jgi:two-component system sensor histidine kinase PilS (NtrC family)
VTAREPPSTPPRPDTPGYFPSHWRSLDYFNLYRLTLAVALLFAGLIFSETDLFRTGEGKTFSSIAFLYLLCAALFVLGIRARWLGFKIQLTAHIFADILFVVMMMTTSERLTGGLGLLLVISIASGGLVGSGRLSLLYAALASIAVLLEHGFSILGGNARVGDFFQIGLLCLGYFATGLLAHALTRRALASETLAARQAEELALLNRINALAIENSPDGILAVNGDGSLRHANPRARMLLGNMQAITPGRTLLRDIAPTLAGELARCLVQGGATGTTLATATARLRVRCIPLGAADNSMVLVLEDLTQAEQSAQRIKLAALGRLTANIAHEIRNPLSAISHAAQLLHEEARGPAQARLPQIIENNARRIDRLVRDVLSLNRRDRIKPESIDTETLRTLVAELCQAEEIPAEAVIVGMQSVLPFSFDPEHLRQIVWNLLRNGWRYSRRQPGSVHLSLRHPGNTLLLDISDDGPGVAPEHQVKLFEPFFTTDAQGTGLGLFLARELAEANGASLAYVAGESGGTFRLTLQHGTY